MNDDLIMFDKLGAIRMYNPDKYEQLVSTIDTERQYIEKMEEFRNVVNQTMTIVESLGKAIEREKLRAIGNRNIVESEAEERGRMVQEAEVRLREKRIELDRHKAEYESLKKVELFQRRTIQGLSQTDD